MVCPQGHAHALFNYRPSSTYRPFALDRSFSLGPSLFYLPPLAPGTALCALERPPLPAPLDGTHRVNVRRHRRSARSSLALQLWRRERASRIESSYFSRVESLHSCGFVRPSSSTTRSPPPICPPPPLCPPLLLCPPPPLCPPHHITGTHLSRIFFLNHRNVSFLFSNPHTGASLVTYTGAPPARHNRASPATHNGAYSISSSSNLNSIPYSIHR
ncbi:hypothetical protein EV715DRAFT_295660 [Schizophyllum commune]